MAKYTGSCHCGKITYEFTGEITRATSCNCSLCTAKNARMTYTEKENFRLLSGAEFISEYNWNTGVARHYFCQICGIYTHHQPRTKPEWMGINLGTVDNINVQEIPVKYVNGRELSGENTQ